MTTTKNYYDNDDDDDDGNDDNDDTTTITTTTTTSSTDTDTHSLIFLYSLLSVPRIVSNCTLKWPGRSCVQTTCNTLGAFYVLQKICLSLAPKRYHHTVGTNNLT